MIFATWRYGCSVFVVLPILLMAFESFAAGLYLAPRGVRPLARAGAFVAGADDIHALSYNPAGLSLAKNGLWLDLSYPVFRARYQRRISAQSPYLEAVEGRELGLPIPTIGGVYQPVMWSQWHFAAALLADEPALQNWPDFLRAPQRYGVLDYKKTLLAKAVVGASYRPWDCFAMGLSLSALAGQMHNHLKLSACDGVVCQQAENSSYDVDVQMVLPWLLTPSVQLGFWYQPHEKIRFAATWSSQFNVSETAHFTLQLPTAPMYRFAHLDPQKPQGRVSFQLPSVAAVGVEANHGPWRLELTSIYTMWQVHDVIHINLEQSPVIMREIVGIGDYQLKNIDLPRFYRGVVSWHLGGEWLVWNGQHFKKTFRLGIMYEPSAIADPYLTANIVDLQKIMYAGGSQLQWQNWALEWSLAYIQMRSRSIDKSAILQINPTRPPWSGRTAIGNGLYEGFGLIVGLGLKRLF